MWPAISRRSQSKNAANCFRYDFNHLVRSRSNSHKLALVFVVAILLSCSFCWALSISGKSPLKIYSSSHRRLRQQLVADLLDIGRISPVFARDIEFCPIEYEDYVPCHSNVSESMNLVNQVKSMVNEQKKCSWERGRNQGCLILPPKDYKIPLRWPTGRDFIWKGNVKINAHEFSSGSLTKRLMVEDDQISFRFDSLMVDGVEDYSHQIAEMIGLKNESNFNEAGVRSVLDIGCGFGSFGALLFSRQLLTLCIADYEESSSQVQITLERGLPAMIGSFATKQLPFPYLSFDMLHCANCDVQWEADDGVFLVEVDRLLKPGGYFVWTDSMISHRSLHDEDNQKKWTYVRDFASNLCWDMLSQEDETVVWKKTSRTTCYTARKYGPVLCGRSNGVESPYYQPLTPCVAGTRSQRWIAIEDRRPWPSREKLNKTELETYDLRVEEFTEDSLSWDVVVHNYWSLLSPQIFSDHPKRPGDEDPSPPFNMLRNVLDMNARFGGFNSALLDAGKNVWFMNVVPINGPNYLPLIFDRGFIGIQHDWCEPFPTYPRTYDLVHAEGLLLLESQQQHRCSMLYICLEIDRILRPEGWVILRDKAPLIEAARLIAVQLKWDVRVIELDSSSDDKLLVWSSTAISRTNEWESSQNSPKILYELNHVVKNVLGEQFSGISSITPSS